MKDLYYTLILLIGFTLLFYSCNRGINDNKPVYLVEKITFVNSCRPAISLVEKQMIEAGLVNISEYCPSIRVELRYSTVNNFLCMDMYGDLESAYLQPEAAQKLCIAQEILKNIDNEYSLIVFDAARPLSIQQIMWDSVDVPQQIKHWYVANPNTGSIHNYAMAIDASIVDDKGELLDMGTKFDYFGELAYPGKEQGFLLSGKLDSTQVANRELLYKVMAEAGFYVSKTEWWHYSAASLNYSKSNYEIIK